MFWRHDKHFDVLTNVLTSWRTFCRNEELDDVVTNVLTSWHIFDIVTDFLTSWRTFDVIMNILATWWTFWRYDELLTSWWIFDVMTSFLMSWSIFDVMTNFLTSWHICVVVVFIVCLYCPCYITEIDMIVVFFCNLRKCHTRVWWYLGSLNSCRADNWHHLGVGLAAKLCFLSYAPVLNDSDKDIHVSPVQ